MDPNALLQEMNQWATVMSQAEDKGDHALRQQAAEEIAWRFVDLDEWIVKGGFLPGQWSNKH